MAKEKLFHLSENGNLNQFVPKPSKEMWGFEKYVWAISEAKVHNYLLPRACPRICLTKNEVNIIEDWVDDQGSKAYIFVPFEWVEMIAECTLYKYQFGPDHFVEIDAIAGYFVSPKIEVPVGMERIDNCLRSLSLSDVQVKFLEIPQMIQLRELVLESAKEFSIIKWDNLGGEIF